MNGREAGFLLLTSQLGNPKRDPLTVAQFRTLASRVRFSVRPEQDRELRESDLTAMGYSHEMAGRILRLLGDKQLLEYYLQVRKGLGDDSPGCLWAKGDTEILRQPCVALVGSRDLGEENKRFAQQVGIQAAKQGFVLVSGNARGADQTAQEACLRSGGKVICVVADSLEKQKQKERVLYLSEESFDSGFSSQRALSRNRIIHSLGQMTFVAQSSLYAGGTWDGTARNLKARWSSVFCFRDGSEAAAELERMGAQLISIEQLHDLTLLKDTESLFDRV